jgi:YD repeat-containing protein
MRHRQADFMDKVVYIALIGLLSNILTQDTQLNVTPTQYTWDAQHRPRGHQRNRLLQSTDG